MFELIILLLFVLLILITYIVSVYSLAVYIDPADVEQLFSNTSKSRRRFLMRLAGDARAFTQIAVVFKSIALIICTFIVFILLRHLIEAFEINGLPIYLAGTVIFWMIYITAAEILPRRASRTAINNKMLKHLWVIALIYFFLFPIVGLYRRALQLARVENSVTEEEKEEIVERAIETLAEEAGITESIVEEDEKEMIGQIFLLDQTVAREIMVPRMDIVGIEKESSFQQITELVGRDGHSRYPVFDGTIDKILGIVYVKDMFSRLPDENNKFVLTNYLREPYRVHETKVIGELLREFKNTHTHIALVLDEYGGVAGLVTMEDILEEIFGEIQDEHDLEDAEIKRLPDGRLLVNASIMVEKLQDYLETDFKQEDYDTVGGLIYDLVGSVPNEGQTVRWHAWEFEVEKVEGQRIRLVKVRV